MVGVRPCAIAEIWTFVFFALKQLSATYQHTSRHWAGHPARYTTGFWEGSRAGPSPTGCSAPPRRRAMAWPIRDGSCLEKEYVPAHIREHMFRMRKNCSALPDPVFGQDRSIERRECGCSLGGSHRADGERVYFTCGARTVGHAGRLSPRRLRYCIPN